MLKKPCPGFVVRHVDLDMVWKVFFRKLTDYGSFAYLPRSINAQDIVLSSVRYSSI